MFDFRSFRSVSKKFGSIILMVILFVGMTPDIFSQVKGKVRGGLDIGGGCIANGGNGFTMPVDLNFGYNPNKNMTVGVKLGISSMLLETHSNDGTTTFNFNISGTYNYYWGTRTNLTIPFVGCGFGLYMVYNGFSDYWGPIHSTESKFGGFITTGVEIGKVRLALKYELIPASKVAQDLKITNSYLTLTAGFYLGGGTRKKAAAALEREKAEKILKEQEREAALKQKREAELEREKIALEREKIALEQERLKTLEQADVKRGENDGDTCNSAIYNDTDIIMLRNGQEIKAKITEITFTEVKYKLIEHLDGPTRAVEKTQVVVILYGNGKRELISTTPSKRQSGANCAKKNAFGLDVGIGGNSEWKTFTPALGIRVTHHFNPYFGMDFFKINCLTDVSDLGGLNVWVMRLQLMSGIRGNSPAFFKCLSVYTAFRLGYGMLPASGIGAQTVDVTDYEGLCLEAEFGINLTPAIFTGFTYNYHKHFGIGAADHTFAFRLGFNFGK